MAVIWLTVLGQRDGDGVAAEAGLHRLGAVVGVDCPNVATAAGLRGRASLLADETPRGVGRQQDLPNELFCLGVGGAMAARAARPTRTCALVAQNSGGAGSRSDGETECIAVVHHFGFVATRVAALNRPVVTSGRIADGYPNPARREL
jgi:hypothetical protein